MIPFAADGHGRAPGTQHVNNAFVVGFDWFRADYLWHEGETQAVNTFNLGATLHW